jgi:hypothetical protein
MIRSGIVMIISHDEKAALSWALCDLLTFSK